ncbi:hypothetical protein N7548_00165 [Acholeplasma manati]|uniref:Uncharacterized protein n=1 Tax=Paracholeplasma manati TaxID=591373 RepID=A0ABT2Y3C7_9MOLU|nr:hypothetical protein [Paracholeplasma manati]MCV2231239.1 hypothetical protein [Paracholeplasma manati]
MTLSNLDQYIQTYIHKLQLSKAISGIQNIEYSVKRSTRSQSLYIYLMMSLYGKTHTKIIRISDHYNALIHSESKNFEDILIKPNEDLNHESKRYIEKVIQKKIKELLRKTTLGAMYHYMDKVKQQNSYSLN